MRNLILIFTSLIYFTSCSPVTCHYKYEDAALYCPKHERDSLDEQHQICKDYELQMVCDEK